MRLYDTVAVLRHELSTAARTATAIFDDAGVTMRWRPPRTHGPLIQSDDPCDDVVQSLDVRLVTAPANVDPKVLGYSLVRPTRTGTLATLCADHFDCVAARLRITCGMLLGGA